MCETEIESNDVMAVNSINQNIYRQRAKHMVRRLTKQY